MPAEVRLYDRLFTVANPDEVEEGKTFKDSLNPKSLERCCRASWSRAWPPTAPGSRCQFVRHGYFIVDEIETRPGALVFNRIVDLPDAYGKALAAAQEPTGAPTGRRRTAIAHSPRATPSVPSPRNECGRGPRMRIWPRAMIAT